MTVVPSPPSLPVRASSGATASNVSNDISSGKKRSSAHFNQALPSLMLKAKAFSGQKKNLEQWCSLQSSDKRRRYLRRGSKTSKMLHIPLSISAKKTLERLDQQQQHQDDWWCGGAGSSELSLASTATAGSSICSSSVGGSSVLASTTPSSASNVDCDDSRRNRSVALVNIALHEAGYDQTTSETNEPSATPATSMSSTDPLPSKMQMKSNGYTAMGTLDDFSKNVLKNHLCLASSLKRDSALGGVPNGQTTAPPSPPQWLLDSSSRTPVSHGYEPQELPPPPRASYPESIDPSSVGFPRQVPGHLQPAATVELLASALALSSIHDATVDGCNKSIED